jgi:hypothetical protein
MKANRVRILAVAKAVKGVIAQTPARAAPPVLPAITPAVQAAITPRQLATIMPTTKALAKQSNNKKAEHFPQSQLRRKCSAFSMS